MSEITIAEVDQAEAAYEEAKDAYRSSEQSDEDKATFKAAKAEIVAVRLAWREQETAAGRRTGLAGGDAVIVEG